MRTGSAMCVVVLLFLCGAAAMAAPSTGNSAEVPDKEPQPTGVPLYEGRVEGETIETAFEIQWFPFTDSVDTCPFLDDYDEVCPYAGSTSPDVVYRYDCQYTRTVEIDLCSSGYDTKVYVYENEYTPGSPYACNDDFSGCGPFGFQSWLRTEFFAGNTYYVVIDGFWGDCGEYQLHIEELVPCVWCPPGAVVESEPECMDPENDIHNGGCNSDPPVFDYLEPSEDIIDLCGTSGTYHQSGSNWRDTDWYQLDLAQTSEITVRCIAYFDVRIGFVDGREGCEGVYEFYSYVDGFTCYVSQLTETLPAGTWWLWVGPAGFTGVECGKLYHCEISGYTPATPVESATWSSLKALYR